MFKFSSIFGAFCSCSWFWQTMTIIIAHKDNSNGGMYLHPRLIHSSGALNINDDYCICMCKMYSEKLLLSNIVIVHSAQDVREFNYG